MPELLSQLGAIAAILQLFVTGYLSYRVYKLTEKLLEVEEHNQRPGKLTASAVKKEPPENGFTNFAFRVENTGSGRIEVLEHKFPFLVMEDGSEISANSKSTAEDYTPPHVLEPGDSYKVRCQFSDIAEEEISGAGIEIRSERRPNGYRYVTDSGAGNF